MVGREKLGARHYNLRKYSRKKQTPVVAVQLDLDTEGFTYNKWGGAQKCKRGDWIVNNHGDTYTVDSNTFDRTYRTVGSDNPGLYEKHATIWAKRAETDGSIRTKEGVTEYKKGDYLVFNDSRGDDGYAMSEDTFNSLYEPAEE